MLRVLSLPEKGAALHQSPPAAVTAPAWKRPLAAGRGCQGSSSEGAGEPSGTGVSTPTPSRPPFREDPWGSCPAQRTGRGFPEDPRARRVREGSSRQGRGSPRGGTQGPGAGGTGSPGGSPEPGSRRLLRSLVFNRT